MDAPLAPRVPDNRRRCAARYRTVRRLIHRFVAAAEHGKALLEYYLHGILPDSLTLQDGEG